MQSLLEWFARNRTLVIILIVLAAAFFALRSRQSDAAAGEWEGLVGGGDPVVVEFFSNT
jgi:heme A synthase